MPGQWVDVGARRLIDGTALDSRGQRAARRASAPFARQIVWGCGAAAVGTLVASVLPPRLDGVVPQALWAALWAVAGYVAIWTGLSFITCGDTDLADFATTAGLRDTMTPIPAVLSSSSSFQVRRQSKSRS